MLVVADSGPLHYLILLDQADILHHLYGNVLIPQVVAAELRAARAPRTVIAWVSQPPSWLQIVDVTAKDIASISDELDLGERAAIALSEKSKVDLLLIDESAGRAEARRRSLRFTGTLGVLRVAAEARCRRHYALFHRHRTRPSSCSSTLLYRGNASFTPPSTGNIAPVVFPERGPARNRAASATSAAVTSTLSNVRLR